MQELFKYCHTFFLTSQANPLGQFRGERLTSLFQSRALRSIKIEQLVLGQLDQTIKE